MMSTEELERLQKLRDELFTHANNLGEELRKTMDDLLKTVTHMKDIYITHVNYISAISKLEAKMYEKNKNTDSTDVL